MINIIKNNKGQIFLGLILLILIIYLILIITYFNSSGLNNILSYKENLKNKSYYLAESGLNYAIFKIKENLNWSGTNQEISLNDGTFEVQIITDNVSEKIIQSTGYFPNKNNYKSKTTLKTIITKSPGVSSFKYGAQAGTGGIELNSNAIIFGNVYSSGNINCYSNSYIDGDAFAVGTITPINCSRRQVKTGITPVPLPDFDKNYWIAQAESGGIINGNISYNSGINYLGPKRINGNLTLNTNASLIVTGPIYVTGRVELNSNSTIKIDDSFDTDGTIILAEDKISINNNALILRTESQTNLSPNEDYNNQWNIYGSSYGWEAINKGVGQPTVPNTTKYISSSQNNQIAEFQIEDLSNATSITQAIVWVYAKNNASNSGDLLGVDLIINNNGYNEQNLSLTTNYQWKSITFNFNNPLNKNSINNLRVRLKEIKSGTQDSVDVAALYIQLKYTKENAGYLLFVSDKSNDLAIELNGNASGGVFYARNGILQVNSNSHPVAITAKKLILNSNAQIWYDEGLPEQSFSSGPGGTWEIKPGSTIIINN
ncbi:MAG: hypothetical protein N2Z85_02290 [Patescibacteria group bacterium]|nr:hypothetical protein [Patescibacteria group bacterium]